MTTHVAAITSLISFSAITGWLVIRKPADNNSPSSPPVPNTMLENPSPPATPPADTRQIVSSHLQNIIIPSVNIKNASIEEALDYLRLKSYEVEPSENHSPKNHSPKGISFILKKPSHASETPHLNIPDNTPLISLTKNNISMKEYLDLICGSTGYHWEITNHTILLTPLE